MKGDDMTETKTPDTNAELEGMKEQWDRCDIYATRPSVCVGFGPGDERCRAADPSDPSVAKEDPSNGQRAKNRDEDGRPVRAGKRPV